ncbi:MAG: coproporphyrinogen dehydrogenase HemZ [Firmicutes bacterium]|nr:coproporphyrinogen dehydrogenase HemZ [Bacillota bacterium]
MFRFRFRDEKNRYELTELAKMFVPAEELDCFAEDGDFFVIPGPDEMDRNAQKRVLYGYMSEKTGRELKWGTLTGVRPLKLFNKLVRQTGSADTAAEALKTDYLVSDDKADLLRKVWNTQSVLTFDRSPRAVGLYIGIPFCPTRCLYCSFTSNKYSRDKADAYLNALEKEIDAVSRMFSEKGLYAESLYIGGGTPSSLEEDQFRRLTDKTAASLLSPKTAEFTVECGRPDSITECKLKALLAAGCGRISINPQSMQQRTLERIGRAHGPEDIVRAFSLAKDAGVKIVNADLIAGLPGETPPDMADSLRRIMDLEPQNITVHTLAVKRGSRLIEQDKDLSYSGGDAVYEMLAQSYGTLGNAGYSPYYLYRQKHMTGNMENTGWSLSGCESIYNIRIMEEDQSIIALGAGGVSKLYYPEEDRVERVANVSNYEIYIDRIDEMIKRKEDAL